MASRLSFIDQNPATAAFRRGEEADRANRLRDLQTQGQIAANQEQAAGAPHRLRTMEAGADIAQVNAQYAEPRARAGLRSSNAAALNSEMQGFYKSLELLNAGDTASAMEIARRTGQQIPREVIENAEVRAAVTQAAQHAMQTYPNRPRDQQAYIQSYLEGLAERQQQGGPAHDPRALYQVPGAPEVPEIGAGTQRNPPADVAMAEWLIQYGVAASPQEAWDLVRRARTNPDAIRAQIFGRALTPEMGQRNWDAFQAAGQQHEPAPPAAPAAPSAPAAQQFREGQTATNPQTGQRMIFRGGQWVPMQ
jgi:hypothetical protein